MVNYHINRSREEDNAMTRNELMEDLQVGDCVEICIESNEVYVGTVIDFGESGMKLAMKDSKRQKRIAYSRIVEYDVLDSAEESSCEKENIPVEQERVCEESVREEEVIDEKITEKEVTEEKIIEEKKELLSRDTVFGNVKLDVEELKKYWVSKLTGNNESEYRRANDSLQYAKKINEYGVSEERVERVIASYKRLAQKNSVFNVFLGMLYYEFGKVDEAQEYLNMGGEYALSAYISVQKKDNEAAYKYALMSLEYHQDCEYIIKWLCDCAIHKKDIALVQYVLGKTEKFKKQIVLYWFADKVALSELPGEEADCAENIAYMSKLINAAPSKQDEYRRITSGVLEKNKREEEKENPYLKGVINYYNKNGGFGYIKEAEGGQIYFYIKQVKDVELQKILVLEANTKKRVIYKKGINFKGIAAADEICLDKSFADEPEEIQQETANEDPYTHEGVFIKYDYIKERGLIQAKDKEYSFVAYSIKDPILRADVKKGTEVLDKLQLKFRVKQLRNKKTKEITEIAYDIVTTKEYTDEEVERLIRDKWLTKQDVDAWRNVKKEGIKVPTYFKEIKYVPLSQNVEKTKGNGKLPKKNINVSAAKSTSIEEEKAIALIVKKDSKNPFQNLERIPNPGNYFQEAHRNMVGYKNYNGDTVGVNLQLAEELYIKAIQANDQPGSAVANLLNIYVKMGGEYIEKGLQLLEVYGIYLTADKAMNLKMQLIDKSGNLEALEWILRAFIKNCTKVTTKWQHTTKLASIYVKRQEWAKAADCLKESIAILEENRGSFTQYEKLRASNQKNMAVVLYNWDRKEDAKELADEATKVLPADEILQSIIRGTYGEDGSRGIVEPDDGFELFEEDEYITTVTETMSKYFENKLNEVNLASTFGKVKVVISRLQNGIYTGNTEDAKRVIKYIQEEILSKHKALNAENRSEIYLGIARIISDSRNNMQNTDNGKLDVQQVSKFMARYARYAGDAFVENLKVVDSIRFLYIQALKHLTEDDSGNVTAATDMLVASFFVDGSELPKIFLKDLSVYDDSYYEKNCISCKDLLIATFMLQGNPKRVSRILQKIYHTENGLKERVQEELERINKEPVSGKGYYEFASAWKKAMEKYYDIVDKLDNMIGKTIEEYRMTESLRQYVQSMSSLMGEKILWNQDERILTMYLEIVNAIIATQNKFSIEEKIEGYTHIEDRIDRMKLAIEKAPTELTYEYIYTRLSDLQYSIKNQFNDLYASSQPEISVSLSSDSVYVNGKKAEVAIAFKNMENKQNADAVNIDIKGSEGASFINSEKFFTSIRSGENPEYLAVFELSDTVVNEGQFEISINVSYRYHEDVANIKEYTFEDKLPVTISSKENFRKITNKYDSILRGAGVGPDKKEMFKGRDELISNLCASMSSENGNMAKNTGIILWGQRRVGKNSVMENLKKKIQDEYGDAYIIINMGSVGRGHSFRDFLITMVNQTEDVLMDDYPDIYDELVNNGVDFDTSKLEKTDRYMPEFSRFMNRFSKKLRAISAPEKNIPLYFVDEFSYLYQWIEEGKLDGEEFMKFWKSFIQDYGICAIIIAQDNIPVWRSKYENEFACMNHDNEITYLDYAGAKALICEPCQIGDKVLFEEDAVRLIYQLTRGSAYLIVIFCKHIIDYLNENYYEKVTKTIVQLVLEKKFLGKVDGMFQSGDFEPHIQDVANVGDEGARVNALNRELLKEIAKATISSPQVKINDLGFFNGNDSQHDRSILERLKDRKIVEVENDTYCSISLPLLKLYLLREQALLTREVLNNLLR